MHLIVTVDKERAFKAYSAYIEQLKPLHQRALVVSERLYEIQIRKRDNARAFERYQAEKERRFYIGLFAFPGWPVSCDLEVSSKLTDAERKLQTIAAATGDIEMDEEAVKALSEIESGKSIERMTAYIDGCEEASKEEVPPLWVPPIEPEPEPKPRPSVWRKLFYGD